MTSSKFKNRLVTLAAVGFTANALCLPLAAQAEVSSGMSIASMYLWRGQDLSQAGPAVSGNLDYNHESGAFVGTWASSEGASGSYEWDVYAGYGKKFGDFGVSVSYNVYMYPETKSDADGDGVIDTNDGLADSDASEYMIGANWTDLNAKLYLNTENDYSYLSLDYALDKVGFHVGFTNGVDSNGDASSDANYTDFNVSYGFAEHATVTVSMASGNAVGDGGIEGDPLVVFAYAVPLK